MSYYKPYDADGRPLIFGRRLYDDDTGRINPAIWAAVNQACDEDNARGEWDHARTAARIDELLGRPD